MQDRLALMLDSMIFAVDNGHSFDGIVSVPQIGLEDWGHRPGMAGWLDEGAELLRTIIPRFFHRPSPRPISVKFDKHSRERDSGIASGNEFFGGDPATPLSPGWEEILPTDRKKRSDDGAEGVEAHGNAVEGEKDDNRPREEKAGDKEPRLKVGPSTPEALPRRKRTAPSGGQRSLVGGAQAAENVAHSSSTGLRNEGDIRRPSNLETKEPRLKRNI